MDVSYNYMDVTRAFLSDPHLFLAFLGMFLIETIGSHHCKYWDMTILDKIAKPLWTKIALTFLLSPIEWYGIVFISLWNTTVYVRGSYEIVAMLNICTKFMYVCKNTRLMGCTNHSITVGMPLEMKDEQLIRCTLSALSKSLSEALVVWLEALVIKVRKSKHSWGVWP